MANTPYLIGSATAASGGTATGTVTATVGGDNPGIGGALRILVLTGIASNQGTAASPDAGLASESDSNVTTHSITTTVTGSRVYGAAVANNISSTFTAAAATTMIDNFNDTVNGAIYGTLKATSATGTPGATVLGTSAPNSRGGLAMMEVLPNGTITQDASTPAFVSTTSGNSVTTASFSAPVGSLLVGMVTWEGTGSGTCHNLMSDTFGIGGSGWTSYIQAQSSTNGSASVWYAFVPGAATNLVVPVTTGTTDGDSIIVGVLGTSAGVLPTVGPDTQGNSYSLVSQGTAQATAQLFIYESDGTSALTNVDTIPVTYTSNLSNLGAIAIGDNNVSTVDKFPTPATGSSTAPNSGSSGTLTQAEEHAIGFIVNTNAGGTPTWAAPWSSNVLANITSNANCKMSAAYQVVNATTALTASGTITSAPWTCGEVTTLVSGITVSFQVADTVVGESYSQTLEAIGGVGPYTWSVTAGLLPPGITLSSGVLSGTATVAGDYFFTVTATDAHSIVGSAAQEIFVFAGGAGGASATRLPNNILTPGDEDFETATGLTWVAETNAGTPTRTTQISVTGTNSLKWASTADGDTQISTGFYTIKPSKSYILSGLMMPGSARDCFIGIEWYTSGNSLIRTDYSLSNPTFMIEWQPMAASLTSPSNAAKCKVVAQVLATNAGEVQHIELMYLNQSNFQILVDWVNTPFSLLSNAVPSWDVTMYCRQDQVISLARGRQDSISEVQAGSANFALQNDTGTFTRYNTLSPIAVTGGEINIGKRIQINASDESGIWYTRFDGQVSQLDYQFDNTGNTSLVTVSAVDVLGFLNRQDAISTWTRQQVLAGAPILHWALNDAGNAGGQGIAAESSGNNGPPMRVLLTDTTAVAAIAWQDTTGGIETLADSAGAQPLDGSEFWVPGSNQPTSKIRGLDAGVAGPYTAPAGSVYFSPVLTAQIAVNWFVGNTGFQLQAQLPIEMQVNQTGGDFTFECWATMDADPATGVYAKRAAKIGPYVAMSLGDSRTKTCLITGVKNSGASVITAFAESYNQPPAFLGLGFASTAPPAALQSVSLALVGDLAVLPHHFVLTIQGDPVSPTCTMYIDAVNVGSFTLPTGQVFDTFCVGGAFGGTGCWHGGIQLASIYDYAMPVDQITQNCSIGQYGMWESATDDCVATVASYAGIPPFWNNLTATHSGLTLTDYQDISTGNVLSAMQIFEQAELGFLFVDSNGQLNFHTRDWRMGYGAPDKYLPPNTFDANLGYEVLDQFMQNEAGVATSIFQVGGGYVSAASQAQYGIYATSPLGSGQSLPLISWNRGAAVYGVPVFLYGPAPCLDDFVAWQVNTHSDPWFIPGSLTVDLLTLDATSGLKISDFYNLEIDNMIAPNGTLPASFPPFPSVVEWFIEGINEVISMSERSIQFFTSPASQQRAWKPGDTTYGVLGQTARIGISEPDSHIVQSQGKTVSHDSGRPFWPAVFAPNMNSPKNEFAPDPLLAPQVLWHGDGSTVHPTVQNSTLIPVLPSTTYSFSAWAWNPDGLYVAAGGKFSMGIEYFDSSSAHITWIQNDFTNVMTATPFQYTTNAGLSPSNAAFARMELWPSGTPSSTAMTFAATYSEQPDVITASNEIFFPDDFTWSTFNNATIISSSPWGRTGGFVGALDMRGIVDNLSLKLRPPMCVVSAIAQFQTLPTGSNPTSAIFQWDTINVDTANSFGAVPGYPNWYVCTFPGFYDIDASIILQQTGTGSFAVQGWIVVAEAAAQAIMSSGGSITPFGVANYVCPIGEQSRVNSVSLNTVMSPSTRMYLGLGDMVGVGMQHAAAGNLNTGTGTGGSHMSLIWTGYGQTNNSGVPIDHVQNSATMTGAGGAIQLGGGGKQTIIKSYQPTNTYSYLGNTADAANTRDFTNGSCRQGQYKGGYHTKGDQYFCIQLPFGTMQSDMGSSASIKAITLKCTSNWSWYDSGVTLAVGYSTRALNSTHGPGTSKWILDGNDHDNLHLEDFRRYQTKTFSLPISSFKTLATTATFLIFGCGASTTPNTNLSRYGWWKGSPGQWAVTVTYVK